MKWFKKSYIFVFFMTNIYVLSSSYGLVSDIATEKVLASEYVAQANASLSDIEVIPGGDIIGIKLYTNGIMVVELASFEDETGNIVCPAKDSDIRLGDRIFAVNGNQVESNSELIEFVKNSEGKSLTLTIGRAADRFDVKINPAKSVENGQPKLGIWVRDSAAGIGTLTFVKKGDNKFFALGHAITDKDIRKKYSVRKGSIEIADVLSVEKSREGVPGEVQATFGGNSQVIGSMEGNEECGIFGTYSAEYEGKPVKVASRWQIQEGVASILCSLDNEKPKEYSIRIEKVILGGGFSEKSMVIEVTDPELIRKTGGIVQGMSGSPILQNGRLVGAVTHVFIKNPRKGYGIFAETMLAEAEKIK
ncbi:MAG: SpoIVB peptidase [Monoglobales bacterium]